MSESLLGGNSLPPETTPTPPASTSAPTSTPPVSVVIPDNWKDALPEDVKADPSLGSIMDIASLAKSYVHGQKMIGRDKIVIPDKFATDDDWKKVYHKLGLPESVDKYEFKAPESVDADFLKGFKEVAVNNGILPKQAEKLFEFYDQQVSKLNENQEAMAKKNYEDAVNGLKQEWGQAYGRKLQAASGVFNKLSDENTKKFFTESGFGNNPTVIKLFANIAEQLGEDKFIDAANQGSLGVTPQEAQLKINEIFGNKDHPYFNKNHPSHKDAIAEVSKLFDATTPKK